MFAALLTAALLCACKGNVQPDNSLQITENDLIHLDGTFNDNYLESWDYIILDETTDALLGYAQTVLYDDGLYIIGSESFSPNPQIKVFDSNGHYLNDIGHVGRAKNEYLRASFLALNTSRNEILVYDTFQRVIKRYSYNGDFLGENSTDYNAGITDGFYGMESVKAISDGSLLMGDGSIFMLPAYEFQFIRPDGNRTTPLKQKTPYHLYCDEDPLEYVQKVGDMPGLGLTSTYSDITSDSTYILRLFDNHIYRMTPDSVECLANMSFIPEIPDKIKMEFRETDIQKDFASSIPNSYCDMKDYLYMTFWHNENEYMYEKATSKMYQFTRDLQHRITPDLNKITIYGNTIVGCVSLEEIISINEEMDGKDYNHRFSPDVEAFYRKVRNCENPVIVRIHYKSQK